MRGFRSKPGVQERPRGLWPERDAGEGLAASGMATTHQSHTYYLRKVFRFFVEKSYILTRGKVARTSESQPSNSRQSPSRGAFEGSC